tara:strand:- start:15032 stop:15958 length:927 start_codon:yes stop_codon:yes gene_type:complete
MKISPESFIADEGLCLKYKSIFISGNDESYISSFLDLVVQSFSKNGYLKKYIFDNKDTSPDLFGENNKHVFICNKFVGNKSIEEIESNNDVLVFHEKTSSKNKTIKQFFSKSKERALVECYELDQSKKRIILSAFTKKHSLVFEKNTYWFLLDFLDNRFSILKKELEKTLLLNNKNDIDELASALSSEQSTSANKFFFKINLSRGNIVPFLNSSINSLSDFYGYFSSFKTFSLLMFSSKSAGELDKKIPKYLFREKVELLRLFESLSENKKKLLSSLIHKTEKLVRKNPSLYKPLFFRFVLNYKKIIS